MASTVWSGHLTFGLVSFPVQLATAARRKTVDFNMLHKTDHSRVRQVIYCESEDRPIDRKETVKGYEYEKDRYVVIEPEEIAKVAPPSAKVMEILEFVPGSEVDPIYLDSSFYLAPAEGGEKPYTLLFAAMQTTAFYAVAKIAMHNREYTVIIRPAARGLMLHTMFYADEIRDAQEFRTDKDKVKEKELALAKSLIDALSDKFEPVKYHDAYRASLEQMIAAKVKGKEIVATPAPQIAPVIDIMEALKKSLARKTQAASQEKPKPVAKAATAKAVARKKRTASAA